jgi:HPt (histidine-containing phosphotransfer) domain-containing protein
MEVSMGANQSEPLKSGQHGGPAAAPQSPVVHFNYDELLRRLGGDRELVSDALSLFLTGPQDRFVQMRGALARGDLTNLTKLAHTVRGVALTISAPLLAKLSQDLEAAARASDAVSVVGLITMCEGEHSAVRAAVGPATPRR